MLRTEQREEEVKSKWWLDRSIGVVKNVATRIFKRKVTVAKSEEIRMSEADYNFQKNMAGPHYFECPRPDEDENS